MKRVSRYLIFVLLLTIEIHAGASASVQDTLVLDVYTVTATRTSRRPVETPASISVVSARQMQIEDLSRTVPEALRSVPSVMVQKTSHGQGSPYLRGFTGQQTLFMIDGIRLNNSVFREGPNQYWNTVDLYSLDRVEIVKGPASVLFGSDAIGGAVNAISAPPQMGRSRYFSPRLSYRFSDAELSHVGRVDVAGGVPDKLTIAGGVSPKRFGNLRAGSETGVQEKTGYDEFDGNARVDAYLSEKDLLTAVYQHSTIDDAWRTHSTIYGTTWMNTQTGTDLKRILDQKRDLAYAVFSHSGNGQTFGKLGIRASYQRQGEGEYRVKKDSTGSRQGFEVTTAGLGVQFDGNFPVGLLTAGIDGYRDFITSYRNDFKKDGSFKATFIQGPVADDATYDDVGLFLQDDYRIGRFNVIGGIRFSHFRINANNVLNPKTNSPMQIKDSWNSTVGSLRAMVKTMNEDKLNLFAGISQGFRAPNLSDLTRFDAARSKEFEIPAPGLNPERFWTSEVGIKSENRVIGGAVTGFYTNIDKMIIRTPTGITRGSGSSLEYEITKKNSGKGYVYGLETECRSTLFTQFKFEGVLTLMYGEVDGYPTSDAASTSEPLTRLMPPTGHASITWLPPSLPFHLVFAGSAAMHQSNLSASDMRDTQRIPPDGSPSYYTLDAAAVFTPFHEIEFTIRLNNITDQTYRIHGSGINEPGRSILVGASLRY